MPRCDLVVLKLSMSKIGQSTKKEFYITFKTHQGRQLGCVTSTNCSSLRGDSNTQRALHLSQPIDRKDSCEMGTF